MDTRVDLHAQGRAASLTDTEIAAAAGISLSKLATLVVRADGAQPFTAAANFGGFRATNLATPTATTDAATKAYVDALGLWQTYTPTWSGLTVGNGTVMARWARVNKVIYVEIILIWGSTTAATGTFVFSLPANNAALSGAQLLGTGSLYDASADAIYPASLLVANASSAVVHAYQPTTTGGPIRTGGVGPVFPFTWAAPDQFGALLTYREP